MKQQVADILRGAINAIEERGWIQGDYRSVYSGSVCLVGALACGANVDPVDVEEALGSLTLGDLRIVLGEGYNNPRAVAVDAVATQIPEDWNDGDRFRSSINLLIDWNDTAGREVDEVVTILNRALEEVEGGEWDWR